MLIQDLPGRDNHRAQEANLLDYVNEVEHAELRIARLDRAIEEAVKSAPPKMRAVIAALQASRGVAQVAAVTIVAEVGMFAGYDSTVGHQLPRLAESGEF